MVPVRPPIEKLRLDTSSWQSVTWTQSLAERVSAYRLITAFEQACLSPPEHARLRYPGLDSLMDVSGVLLYQDAIHYNVVCSATLVGTSVFTAKHCFYNAQSGLLLGGSFAFARATQPTVLLPLKSVREAIHPKGVTDTGFYESTEAIGDFVFAPLAAGVPGPSEMARRPRPAQVTADARFAVFGVGAQSLFRVRLARTLAGQTPPRTLQGV